MAESYAIGIAGKWSLEDLYVYPRNFEQVYFLLYSFGPRPDRELNERIDRAYEIFPWQGGFSAVNFYDQLRSLTPRESRPTINSIEYHSPGFIELQLAIEVATQIGTLVAAVAGSIALCNATYSGIVKGMQKRKLMRLEIESSELRLARDELDFVRESSKSMGDLIGVDVAHIDARAGHPYRTLKILLSLYRRLRKLAEYQNRGKASLPGNGGLR